MVQVVPPGRATFPSLNPQSFRNLERVGRRLLVDTLRLRTNYIQNYRTFCRDLELACGNVDIDYEKFVTTEPYHKALGAFLDARARRFGKK